MGGRMPPYSCNPKSPIFPGQYFGSEPGGPTNSFLLSVSAVPSSTLQQTINLSPVQVQPFGQPATVASLYYPATVASAYTTITNSETTCVVANNSQSLCNQSFSYDSKHLLNCNNSSI